MVKEFFLLTLLFVAMPGAYAQWQIPGKETGCYSSGRNMTVTRSRYDPEKRARSVRQTGHWSSLFNVQYHNVPAEAQPAIEHALDTWAAVLSSPVTINTHFFWGTPSGGTLASTRPGLLFKGFSGAISPHLWYPVSLAEKLSGRHLNAPEETDIEITINEKADWYLDVDAMPPDDRFDLVTVVLHELAHGLGFASSAGHQETKGILKDEGYLHIYDALLQNNRGIRLSEFREASDELYGQLTGGNIFLYGTAFAGNFPEVYAPDPFVAGASISHLDYGQYTDDNQLMQAHFAPGQAVHGIGNVVLNVLNDLGWGDDHIRLQDVFPFPNPSSGSVTLHMPIHVYQLDVAIMDITGKLMARYEAVRPVNSSLHIDIAPFRSGVYIMLLKTPEGELLKRNLMLK